MTEDQYIDKLRTIRRYLILDPNNAIEVEKFNQGSLLLELALRAYPSSSDLWSFKGYWLFTGAMIKDEPMQFEEREKCYLNAIKFDELDHYPYEALGSLYDLHDKDPNTSINYLKKAIELGADQFCYADLARVYAQMGHRDLAIEIIRSATQKFGRDPIIDCEFKDIEDGGWDPQAP